MTFLSYQTSEQCSLPGTPTSTTEVSDNAEHGLRIFRSTQRWPENGIRGKMEKYSIAHTLDKKLSPMKNGRTGMIGKHCPGTFTFHDYLRSAFPSECAAGSCPHLMMSRNEQLEARRVAMALTPQLPPRTHRPLCLSISSDSNGRFKALDTQEWKNNLKAQMEQAHSAGAASSTGSLERASLFCASSSSGGLPSPVEPLAKGRSSSRFGLFSPPWNSSSESDSNPPSRSGSKKLRKYTRRGGAGGGATAAKGEEPPEPKPPAPQAEHFQYAEPFISKVTDYIYVGNLNAAYSGRALCRNNIDSIVDMSSLPGESSQPRLIPCTCSSRSARHTWSRLKVDIGDLSDSGRQRCFQDINECIDASAGKRKRVLVHCRDGHSLAPTCVIQYLMVRRNMRLLAAYELLRARYPLNIEEGHQDVLVSLERALWPGANVDPEFFKVAISRRVAWT